MNRLPYLFGLFLFFSLGAQELPSIFEEPPQTTQETLLEDNIRNFVRGNNLFAFSLYQHLKGQQGNLFFSPYCISSAMAIPYSGSSSGTKEQMQTVMRYLPQSESLNMALSSLNKRLTKPWLQGPNEIRLLMANSLWVQRTLSLEPDFLSTIKKYFGNVVRSVDFVRNPDAARLNINEWVREGTEGRRVDLKRSPKGS